MNMELRANYYNTKGRKELDIHRVGVDGRPFKVETIVVADKRDARRIAAERGAIEWNF
jgi:hypothetical protein